MMTIPVDDRHEWLEADGAGGFASGTTSLVRTRRYHALLLAATTPPTGRMVLVNGFDAEVATQAGRAAISSQHYAPDVVHPDGVGRIRSFSPVPWPTWEIDLPGGGVLVQEILVDRDARVTLVRWTGRDLTGQVVLTVRPFLSGRDYHATHHENAAFAFEPERDGAAIVFRPYSGVPAVVFASNGTYRHEPQWYRQFAYREEAERGLDATEDLAAPGELQFGLSEGSPPAAWMLQAGDGVARSCRDAKSAVGLADLICTREHRRRLSFATALDRAADAYLVRRGDGRTLVAGYPWFTDWGRDTFIALRGLCLATGRLVEARDILLAWAGAVSEGMLPNRFPDTGAAPEYNSVDASLWYVVAVHELLERTAATTVVSPGQRAVLHRACRAIVDGYAAGTRFGIRMDDDGLLMAGVPGVQLTWMDAVVGDRVVTPRTGKPIEIQALWINALRLVGAHDPSRARDGERATASFNARFWTGDGLADVVDVDHVPGVVDATLRPNQIFAVGGLPFAVVSRARGRAVVERVRQTLLTPLGLRSLAPTEPGYVARYEGGPSLRDAAYHQGTVWPWLIGPFVEAWVRVRQSTPAAKRAARAFVEPLLSSLGDAGIGHVSEIADAEPPFTPRGCPFQAWSLGELLRLEREVLAEARPRARRAVAADRSAR